MSTGSHATGGPGPDDVNRPTIYAEMCLSNHPGSLDEEHRVNAYFRDNGIGLVPRVEGFDLQAGFATVAAAAIVATFNVPLGWHVIDDGRRTLIFDAENKIQVNLRLADPEGQTDDQILDAIFAGMSQHHPQLQQLRLDLGGMRAMGLRGIVEGGEVLEQGYLLRRNQAGMVLVTRATSAPEHFVKAMNLAEVILRDLDFAGDRPDVESSGEEKDEANLAPSTPGSPAHDDPGPAQDSALGTQELSSTTNSQQATDNFSSQDSVSSSSEPGWWCEAQELERQDRLEEAEALVTRHVLALGGPPDCQMAELYRCRMMRLLGEQRHAEARVARERAIACMWSYASQSTSGGEGAARSYEAREFEKSLPRI